MYPALIRFQAAASDGKSLQCQHGAFGVVRQGGGSAINFTPIANVDNHDHKSCIYQLRNNPDVANPIAPQTGQTAS
jgi:hypothetical protein